ncbi:MAG: site-specific integrase [Steroidobacteraceae bacterium]
MDASTAALAQLALLTEPPAALAEGWQLCAEAEKAVAAFFHEGQSRHTARTYQTALRYWGAWHALRFGTAIAAPVEPTVVIQFIVDHLEHLPDLPPPEISPYTPSSRTTQHLLPLAIDRRLVDRHYKAQLGPWSLATVQTRLAALSCAHEHYIAGNAHLNLGPEANPLRDPRVRQLIAAARRAYARRGRDPSRPIAATRSVMQALLATCGDDLVGKRDRALLLFGWASGGRRRSEIIAASFENVRRDGAGFIYELGRSKTRQSARRDARDFKPIQGIAAEALQAWIDVLVGFRITEGKLFRAIRHERLVEPLSDGSVREIVRRRAQLANQPLGKLSAHSLRSGFVTEAGKQGLSLGETMAMTGHRSVQTVMGYYQSGELSSSRAARLLDRDPSGVDDLDVG